MSQHVYRCRRCHLPRQADEVVELTHVRTGVVTYLCRPSSSQQLCFANSVFARSEELLAAVVDDGDRGDA